jgi:hypothetical protein
MQEKKKVTGVIQIYSRKARDQIAEIGLYTFKKAGVVDVAEDIFSCVDELIKNAVKANYKFILILNKIEEDLAKSGAAGDLTDKVNNILMDRETYDRIASSLTNKEEISDAVRQILNEESKFLTIKNRLYQENRDYTDDERKTIANLKNFIRIRDEVKKRNMRIILKIDKDPDFIFIEVTNTAPILSHDLMRIYKKRDEYKYYRMEGREYEFFINNIDTSDSGFGLGYAKIDSFLANIGLDPEGAVTIISATSTTAMLTIPLKLIRKQS